MLAPILGLAVAAVSVSVAVALVGAVAAGARDVRRAARERAARVAHEVRGPLSAAQLALHAAARRGEVPPRLVAALELELRRAVLALDPDAPSAVADVDLGELLRVQAETWRAVAAAHGTRVVLRPGADTPLVRADALRVAQATSNVVANAIEHGEGTVEIRTRAVGDRVRVEVSDGGVGLPAPVTEIASRARDGEGARGRGLAIATDAVAGSGGRVAALPARDGACVAIELPAAVPAPVTALAAESVMVEVPGAMGAAPATAHAEDGVGRAR